MERSSRTQRRGRAEVLLGALAFAASVPASKLFLGRVPPLALSGAYYLSSGLALGFFAWLGRGARDRNRLRGADWGWLALAVATGGVFAPLALFLGLSRVASHQAGLLLNFEAVFTVVLAAMFHGERLGARGSIGALGILAGAFLLAWPTERAAGAGPMEWSGVALVIAACALWAIDNNVTLQISVRDARQIVALKGLIGGSASLLLAMATRSLGEWSIPTALEVFLVGSLSFGVSLVLYVRGLRMLGVLQTGVLFALAPGMAAVLSWLVLGEPVRLPALLALALMTAGALLLAADPGRARPLISRAAP